MSRIAWVVARAIGLVSLAVVGSTVQAAEERLNGRGLEMQDQTNAPWSEHDPQAPWPLHSAVDASLSEDERVDGLGRVRPTRSNFPSAYVQATPARGEVEGAAGYTPVESLESHQPFSPFTIAR